MHMNKKNLGMEHSFLLRLLDHGEMTAATLTSVTFGTITQTRRLLKDLINVGLVERTCYAESIRYRKM